MRPRSDPLPALRAVLSQREREGLTLGLHELTIAFRKEILQCPFDAESF
jgi:hypothetical protein